MKNVYDEILYPEIENAPLRSAILRRNTFMVDCADYVVAYVKYQWGGARKTFDYAQRKKKQIFNLADYEYRLSSLPFVTVWRFWGYG